MRRLGEVRWEVGFWQFVDILRRAEGPGASKRASNGNGTPARPVKFPPRSGMAPSLRLLVITQNPWRHSRFSNAKIAIIISQSWSQSSALGKGRGDCEGEGVLVAPVVET
jgi:hypothetical protein